MDTWNNFLFLRHGQTDWNLEGRFQGTADIPLNATGVDQANAAADVLIGQRVDRIVSSPLVRALKTAAIVSEKLSMPIDVDSEMVERGFGRLEGLSVKQVKEEIGIPLHVPMAGHLPPDAEQWPDTKARTQSAIGNWLTKYPDQQILFVAHHGQLAALSELLIGSRMEGKNSVPYQISQDGAVWRINELS